MKEPNFWEKWGKICIISEWESSGGMKENDKLTMSKSKTPAWIKHHQQEKNDKLGKMFAFHITEKGLISVMYILPVNW